MQNLAWSVFASFDIDAWTVLENPARSKVGSDGKGSGGALCRREGRSVHELKQVRVCMVHRRRFRPVSALKERKQTHTIVRR